MRITDIETITLSTEWRWRDEPQQRSYAVVKIHTDEGLVGIGRTSPSGAALIQQHLKPLLLDEDPLNLEHLWHKMYQTSHAPTNLRGRVIGAIGAVDVALWDVNGKALGKPVYQLLGGFRDRVPAYADGGMHARTPDELAEMSAGYVAMGFRAVKFHILGESPEQVLEEVQKTRAAMGGGVRLMVDMHKQWDPWTAVRMAQQLEDYDVFWLEEPIAWDDELYGLAMLASATKILVAAGEGECTLYACRDLMARGGVKVMQTDIVGGGGFTAWRRIAALAQAYHAHVAPHGASFPELSCHLVAAVPNGLIVSAFPPDEPYQIWDRLYREPIRIEGGEIHLRSKPGLGLELDEEFIKRHRA